MTHTSSKPASPVGEWLARDANGWLCAAAVLFALIYCRFWPLTYTTMDEAGYVGNAYLLRHGTVYADQAHVFIATNFLVDGHFVSKYPLGMAALIALVSFAGWKTALGVNLFVHLATFSVFVRLVRRIGVPGIWGLLYLLHPTAVLFCRTAMADLFSGLLLALAFDALLRARLLATGLLAGLAIAVRTGNIVFLPAFALAPFAEPWLKSGGEVWGRVPALLRLSIGFIPGLAFAAYFLVVLTHGQVANNTGTFHLHYFGEMFPAYAASLLVLYPGMLLAPALYRGPQRVTLMALCYGVVLLYSFWFYRDTGSSMVENLIVGQRYMLAVLPLFLLAYAEVLWRLIGARLWVNANARPILKGTVGACALVLFVIGFLVQKRHEELLTTLALVRDRVYATTTTQDRVYCNPNIAKLLHPAWGRRDVVLVLDAEQAAQDARQWLASAPRSGRVVGAYWARSGRAMEQEEANRVARLGQLLRASPEKKEANGSADLNLFTLAPDDVTGGKVP